MKTFLSILSTLVLLWGVMMFYDYNKTYKKNTDKFLITIDIENNADYTRTKGLGYSVTKYSYDKNNLHDGQILKDFKIFGFVVSKEVVVLNEA